MVLPIYFTQDTELTFSDTSLNLHMALACITTSKFTT